jgi:hypothetical protein
VPSSQPFTTGRVAARKAPLRYDLTYQGTPWGDPAVILVRKSTTQWSMGSRVGRLGDQSSLVVGAGLVGTDREVCFAGGCVIDRTDEWKGSPGPSAETVLPLTAVV